MVRPTTIRLSCAALLLGAGLSAASAADVYEAPAETAAAPDDRVSMVIELGLGGIVSPTYEGSDDYEVSPYPIISLDYLSIPGLVSFGSPEASIAGGFVVAYPFAFLANRYMIARGKGHAVVHQYH